MSTKYSKKPLVFLGVSGGVDSSVSAALLLEQGYDVVGVFIKTWQPEWIECTWREEKRDAMRVCAHLGIPFLFFDFEKEYKEGVADYMIEEYKAGRTPNPDVMCNREIKFGAFYDKARSMGADYVATGHYAQIIFPPLPRGGGSVYSPRRRGVMFLFSLSSAIRQVLKSAVLQDREDQAFVQLCRTLLRRRHLA